MRRPLAPEHVVRLLVVGLLLLMCAGVAMMHRSGPPRGQVYAALSARR
jgi:hypothetical protein